jgi:sugar/nucleoside kinase (ribokinase family)
MDDCHIDRRFVWESRRDPCGLCLSYIEDGERVMLTRPGANLAMSRLIRERFADLAAYLAAARLVHVTSFLDPDTPPEMLRVLSRARELNRRLRISLDLSHDWATHPSEPILGMVGLADYLFLTYREFKALGGHSHGEPDRAVAARVLRSCRPTCTVVVTRQYDLIDVFRRGPGGVLAYRFARSPTAAEQDVEDSTGAGDAFSAGLLAALSSRRLQVELGAYLGNCLARHKIQHRAFEGYASFPDLTRGFLQANEHPQPRTRSVSGVGGFIAHGADPQWEEVRRFLGQECQVPVYALDPSVPGAALDEAMRPQLARCGFAVCVLAAADTFPGDGGRAEQSLVHQAGILQGRYGFRRVAMLVEEGCATFSNVAGLIRLDFAAGHVESTFWQLERMLRREGVMRTP